MNENKTICNYLVCILNHKTAKIKYEKQTINRFDVDIHSNDTDKTEQ